MKDEEIVLLYWQRKEEAIRETEQKYGRYLTKVVYNILGNKEDSEESVNDTYWKAWNSIPPQKPAILSTYLAKLARRTAIDLFRRKNREKRKGSEYTISLQELEDCIPHGSTTEQEADGRLLGEAICAYLRTLSEEARNTFIGRYYFADSLQTVAAYYGMSEAKAKSLLYRTRIGLKNYLEQEGFWI